MRHMVQHKKPAYNKAYFDGIVSETQTAMTARIDALKKAGKPATEEQINAAADALRRDLLPVLMKSHTRELSTRYIDHAILCARQQQLRTTEAKKEASKEAR